MNLEQTCAKAVGKYRRRWANLDEPVEWGGWTLRLDERVLMPGDVKLSPQAADVVAELLEAKGKWLRTDYFEIKCGINHATLRQVLKRIRGSAGEWVIRNRRSDGYAIAKARRQPDYAVEELIDGLERALKAAKKLRIVERD